MLAIILFALSLSKTGHGVIDELAAHGRAQVIVATYERATVADADDMTVVARWKHVAAFAAEVTPRALERLENDPNVRRIDLDEGGHAGLAQSVPLIGGDVVHSMGFTGRGVTVAVLDTGVDETHPDLRDRIADEQCFCRTSAGNGSCPNAQTTQSGAGAAADDNGHGTNVTGIVASKGIVSAPGVAPDASLVIVKVLAADGSFALASQVITGLDWLIDHHPEVRVVNMSLLTSALFDSTCDGTTSYTMAFADAINALRARGTLVFACAGNEGSATRMGAPACVQSTISVGAVYDASFGPFEWAEHCSSATTAADEITCFSDSNATLDLLAPGALITSDGLGGGRSTYMGTSQASPHAAGAAAVLLSIEPELAAAAVEALLKTTGKRIVDPRNGVTVPRVDLLAATQSLLASRTSAKHHRAVKP
jgi:subtilisin family serine protease